MNADLLQSIIAAGLHCEHLAVEGDGRHWYATVVSAEFEGKRLLARQRLVYATLGERIKTRRGACPVHEDLHPGRMGSTKPLDCRN